MEPYLPRRRKEELSFLVVRFLRAYDRFEGICRDFREIAARGRGFGGSGLFPRVRALEALVFDIKEKAHFLFRGPAGGGGSAAAGGPAGGGTAGEGTPGGGESEPSPGYQELERLLLAGPKKTDKAKARRLLADLRRSLVDRSIDASVGMVFHMFLILRECLYQLEAYAPRYGGELAQAERIEYLARRSGFELGEEEAHELELIRQTVQHGQGVASYVLELARRSLERCQALFQETAKLLRLFMEEAGGNEVLVLNLLREQETVERVYGKGAAEQILAHMFRRQGDPGATGLQKALAFVRRRCGNSEGLGG